MSLVSDFTDNELCIIEGGIDKNDDLAEGVVTLRPTRADSQRELKVNYIPVW